MGSCYNPYFSSQFPASNQSCFIKSNLINIYKPTTTIVEQAKFVQTNFSCDLPRSKAFMPPVANAASFFAPKQSQVSGYFGGRTLHLRPPPTKSISPFYPQALVNLQFKNPIQFQNKYYRAGYQAPNIIPIASPLPNQLSTHVHNQLPTLTHTHTHAHNHVHAQMSPHLHTPVHVHNAIPNGNVNQMPGMVGANPGALVQPPTSALMNSLPKPNQVTLTNPQGIKFPMPLAYPYGQPLIENFNQNGLENDNNTNNQNNSNTNTNNNNNINPTASTSSIGSDNRVQNDSEVIVVNADI